MRLSAIAFISIGLLCHSVYAADAQTSVGDTSSTQTKAVTTSDTFLTTNKTKPGVKTLPDGLQYKIITQGSGPTPKETDVVSVEYIGTLTDGTEFDNSYKRGEPATFPVNGVIAGWTEALKLMPTGSTWELYIPASLAYGDQGAPPAIGPNQTLIFKVHLVAITK